MEGNNKEEKEGKLAGLRKRRAELDKEIYQLAVNEGHGLDLVDEDGAAHTSNATAIRLLGSALEELEKKVLWKMGGQIGGVREVAEINIHTNARHVYGNVFLDFDADVLRDYLDGLDNKS